MPTLRLRIVAPMQSWGTQSHFSNRDTGREPSKSGIIGLLCAALGRPRTESIQDLAQLKMGVRIDQAGVMRRDYHTAGQGGYYRVSGAIARNSTIPSDRYYLSDAKFLVGLESDDRLLLDELQHALQNPRWFLFFGRKAFIPSERVWLPDGIVDMNLESAMQYKVSPWLVASSAQPPAVPAIMENRQGNIVRNDQPVSFMPRRFLPRRMIRIMIKSPNDLGVD